MSTVHDRNQLGPSIEKLFHYLAVHVKRDAHVTVLDGDTVVFDHVFQAPRAISISPTLYTRLDDCHGAGNCCRVPFDLVYTSYDRQRIMDYDHAQAEEQFGAESAERFDGFRRQLLERLVEMAVRIEMPTKIGALSATRVITSSIWVQRNTDNFHLSGNKSCPYLFIGSDRYFCGVHPFKPLHCWYPHMVVRCMQPRNGQDRPSVSIGRMQYGRNHKFGCPVLFEESVGSREPSGLFDESGQDGPFYFDQQFEDDFEKLEWTSRSAASLGFTTEDNFAVGIQDEFRRSRDRMARCLSSGSHQPLTLWEP